MMKVMKEKPIKFNENIKISKTISDWTCAYCHQKIPEGEWSFVFYNVFSYPSSDEKEKLFCQDGNGVRVHIHCIESLFKDLKKFKKTNMKELILRNLK